MQKKNPAHQCKVFNKQWKTSCLRFSPQARIKGHFLSIDSLGNNTYKDTHATKAPSFPIAPRNLKSLGAFSGGGVRDQRCAGRPLTEWAQTRFSRVKRGPLRCHKGGCARSCGIMGGGNKKVIEEEKSLKSTVAALKKRLVECWVVLCRHSEEA